MKFLLKTAELLCPECQEPMWTNIQLRRIRCMNADCNNSVRAYAWPAMELPEVPLADIHPETAKVQH